MATRKHLKEQVHQERLNREALQHAQLARRLRIRVAAVVAVALAALVMVFVLNYDGGADPAKAFAGHPANGKPGQFAFRVGKPGPGTKAPSIELPATGASGTFSLAGQRGRTVLLYFQEGLMCQPCWDQLKDIEARVGPLRALGIDEVVSITTDPLDLVRQKVDDEGISTPVLSDERRSVSTAYGTNKDAYVMMQGMGGMHNGHSFVLVGRDGRIKWRADYGGPPSYTMYLPVSNLAADIRAGLRGDTSSRARASRHPRSSRHRTS